VSPRGREEEQNAEEEEVWSGEEKRLSLKGESRKDPTILRDHVVEKEVGRRKRNKFCEKKGREKKSMEKIRLFPQ